MSLAFGYAHGQFSSFYLLSTFGGIHTRLITWRVGAWEPGNEAKTHCSKLVLISIPTPTPTCMVLLPLFPGSLLQSANNVNVKVGRGTYLTLGASKVEKG